MRQIPLILALVLLAGKSGRCAEITFTPRELFRVPFGSGREALGSKVDGGQFTFPRDFTMDEAGHFYIYDTNKHRIVRLSSSGAYEMAFGYPATAQQVFAHTDSRQNLWLLVSDPVRGLYYGIYDPRGKNLRAGIFSRFNHFQLHLDDGYILHVLLSSEKEPVTQTYILDEENLLMKKETVARPPENHHQVRHKDRVYFIDQVPAAAKDDSHQVNRITDESHHGIANIKGSVVYVTGGGDVYTRINQRELDVYDVNGALKGKVILKGLSAACSAIRFDSAGNLYELDGIPDQTDEQLRQHVPPVDPRADFEDRYYTPDMPGMRLILWERH
jgi:hypothetical protein